MKPREPAIGVAQGAQDRGDFLDGGPVGGGGGLTRLTERERGPGEQGEKLQQFLGVACGQKTQIHHLALAFARQRRVGRGDILAHPLEREARVDQPGQSLEPGQSRLGRVPAFAQELCLLRQCAQKGLGAFGGQSTHQKERVADQADQPPPGQVRCPAGAASAAEFLRPLPQPVLRRGAGCRIPRGGQVVKPGKALKLLCEGGFGGDDVPYPLVRGLHEPSRKEIVSGAKLPTTGETADGARFRLGNERRGGTRQRRAAGGHTVPEMRPMRGKFC